MLYRILTVELVHRFSVGSSGVGLRYVRAPAAPNARRGVQTPRPPGPSRSGRDLTSSSPGPQRLLRPGHAHFLLICGVAPTTFKCLGLDTLPAQPEGNLLEGGHLLPVK